MESGDVVVVDLHGREQMRWRQHERPVNALSLDGSGEFIGSCSDDGKVIVRMIPPNGSDESAAEHPSEVETFSYHQVRVQQSYA